MTLESLEAIHDAADLAERRAWDAKQLAHSKWVEAQDKEREAWRELIAAQKAKREKGTE